MAPDWQVFPRTNTLSMTYLASLSVTSKKKTFYDMDSSYKALFDVIIPLSKKSESKSKEIPVRA